MNDLIERLREEADGYGHGPTTLTNEEIVELRSLLREAAAALTPAATPGDGATHLIATISQAFAEVRHALDVGPNWYTRGEGGMFMQVDTWVRKGAAAAEKLAAQKEGNGNG